MTNLSAADSVDEPEVQRRLAALADELVASGDLRNNVWRDVFTRTWRHLFVPRYLVNDNPRDWTSRWRSVDGTKLDQRSEWFDAVYSNETLIIDVQDEPVPAGLGGGTTQVITSSSTLPGLVLSMLDVLDVDNGQRVLEIGTGSGYNAALLCGRLGDRLVTSMDISPVLVDAARARLAAHGFRPHLQAGNGDNGVPERAPFDRIIATCSVERVPYAWIEQTRVGGVVLVNVRGPFMHGALARLIVRDAGVADGLFASGYGAFMALRDAPGLPYIATTAPVLADDDGVETTSSLDPATLSPRGGDQAWGFFAQIVLSDLRYGQMYLDDDGLGTRISSPDGSWALVAHTSENGRHWTVQGGPRRLWHEMEAAHQQWRDLGEPSWDRFGLTVTPDRHAVWLDDPAGEHTWMLLP